MPDLVEIVTPGGVKFTVSKEAASAFTGLLTDLEGQGYKIDQSQSGGYANRNIAGTNTPSQHSFGSAIDINWHWNPRGANTDSDMPPNIRDLAKKHGLTWGGDWSGDTRDPMHFEFQPGGRRLVADAAPTVDQLKARIGGSQPPAAATTSELPAPSADDLKGRVAATLAQTSEPKPGEIDPITGRPYQFAGTAPGPVGQSTGRPIREDLVPGAGVQAINSMASDAEQKRRIAAAQLFPDLSPTEAQARVFYGPNGRLAAVGQNGQAFYVDPAPYAPDPMAPTVGGMMRSFVPSVGNVASVAGPALPAVGATALGAAAAPTSLVVGPVAAGAGAATGDIIRQIVANRWDPQSPGYNPLQTAEQASTAAAGQFVGAVGARAFAPNPLRASSHDISTLRKNMPDVEAAYQRAEAEGVTLTPGQASGLPSLLRYEDVAASGSASGKAQDIANAFYQRQRQQLLDAIERRGGQVSPVADKTDAALQFQQGAEDATRIVRQQANAAARPSYQAAEGAGQVMSPDLAQLMEAPAVKTAMEAARKEYQNLYRKPAPDTPDFALWDLTKRKLDDAHTVAVRAGENTTAHAVDTLRGDLLTHLDAAYPTYGTARATAAPGQQAAARMQETLGTKGAPDLGTDKAWQIVRPVFDTKNPRAIAESRAAFTQAGRQDEWNAGLRSYIQNIVDQASSGQEGLNAASLLRKLWNDPTGHRREALQAAMDPQAFKGLENFIGTLENVAKSHGMNSLTAPRQAGANALAEAGASTPGVKAVNLLGTLLSPQTLWQGAKTITDPITHWMTRRNVDRIASNLFDEQGLTFLRAMASAPAGGMKAVTAASRFLGALAAGPSTSPDRPNLLAVP